MVINMDRELLELTRKSVEAETSISKSIESINKHTETLAVITGNQNNNLAALENSMVNLNDKFGLHVKNSYELSRTQIKYIIYLTAALMVSLGGAGLLKLFEII